jgi:hypothetical protein
MRQMRTRLLRQVGVAVLLLGVGLVVGLVGAGSAAAMMMTKTKTIRYGPITVPAAEGMLMGELRDDIKLGVKQPCSNCYITSMRANYVTASGKQANAYDGLLMHHMVLFAHGREDATCGPETLIGGLGQRFFAAGNERTPMMLPPGYGYYVGENEYWILLYMLMNGNEKPETTYIEVTYGYMKGKAASEEMKSVTPVWLDENDCSNSEITIPHGPSDTAWNWTDNTAPGEVVAIAGHIHTEGHGIKIEANDETTHTHICTSKPTYGGLPEYISDMEMAMNGSVLPMGSPYISGMSGCIGTPVAVINKGDDVRLNVYYDNPGEVYTGAMGIMLAYVHTP